MFLDISFANPFADREPADHLGDRIASVNSAEVILPRMADDEDEVTISMVASDAQRSEASALINRMFAWRGYGSHHLLAPRPSQTTFTVATKGSVVGTLTLTVDSEAGLATDATFRDELNTYRRQPGAHICELTRFAFDTSSPSKKLLAALFHVIFIYGSREYGCTDLFIEVAQRHRRYYETMLGFERVCDLRTNASVGVPSQLMRLNVADIQRHIDAHADLSDGASCRSLYNLFFSKKDEERIYNELTQAAGRAPSVMQNAVSHDISAPVRRTTPDQATRPSTADTGMKFAA